MYKLTNDPDVIILFDKDSDSTTTIPRWHRCWDEYEQWLAEGNEPEPIETAEQKKKRLYYQAIHRMSHLRNITDYAIAPLQDMVDLNIADSEEKDKLKELKKFRADLYRLQNKKEFPDDLEWPKIPKVLEEQNQ